MQSINKQIKFLNHTIKKKTTNFAYLTHFLFKILRHNLKYEWSNVKGVVTCNNY